jgi:sulfopyruvate decarboxylase TPP-binding subunit
LALNVCAARAYLFYEFAVLQLWLQGREKKKLHSGNGYRSYCVVWFPYASVYSGWFLTTDGENMAESSLSAQEIVRAVKGAGIRFIVALPDRTTSERLLKPMLGDPELRVVQVCKEDEGVSICSGLFATGHRALLLIQYTGLLDSMNALRGVAVEGKNPVCMMVGLLGKEPGVPPTQSKKYGLRIVEPILDAMGIQHHLLETNKDIPKIAPAVEEAYAKSLPVVILIGREPV